MAFFIHTFNLSLSSLLSISWTQPKVVGTQRFSIPAHTHSRHSCLKSPFTAYCWRRALRSWTAWWETAAASCFPHIYQQSLHVRYSSTMSYNITYGYDKRKNKVLFWLFLSVRTFSLFCHPSHLWCTLNILLLYLVPHSVSFFEVHPFIFISFNGYINALMDSNVNTN